MWNDTFPLPEGWSKLEVVEDVVVADGIELRRAGLCSTAPDGEAVTGSAVEATGSPLDRSYFELLERVSTLDMIRSRRYSYAALTADGEPAGNRAARDVFPESDEPARWRFARSNGIALHADWNSASLRALWELAERDRVLRAWYGETRPERLAFSPEATPLAGAKNYEWCACSFPGGKGMEFSRGVKVVGVFGFPVSDRVPFVCGYGARPELHDALETAVREAMQLLGFLWGEPPLERLPEPAPTALHHLEHYQWPGHHDALRRWLEEGHERFFSEMTDRPAFSQASFVDLTPTWLRGGLRVAKAVCPAAMQLAFGDSPFAAHLPPELHVHPIA